MKKTTYILGVMVAFVILFASACGGGESAAPVQPVTSAPVQSAPQQPPAVEVQQPTQESAPVQTFAPACQAATTCAAPVVTDKPPYETYCVKKTPYQNFRLPAGTILEPLPKAGDPEFYPLVCADSGTVVDNGLHVFSCRGQTLWTYDLKVTNPACSGSTLQAGSNQCQPGLGYDAANNCCAPMTGGDGGSVTIKVNMGGCPTSNQ